MYLVPKTHPKAIWNISQFPAVWIYYLWCQLNKANVLCRSGYSSSAILVEISQMLPAQYKVNLQRFIKWQFGWVNMTVESIQAVSVLASVLRTKVSIYQCWKEIKLKAGGSSNELQCFTLSRNVPNLLFLLSNQALFRFKKKKDVRVTFKVLCRFFSSQLLFPKLGALGLISSSVSYFIG